VYRLDPRGGSVLAHIGALLSLPRRAGLDVTLSLDVEARARETLGGGASDLWPEELSLFPGDGLDGQVQPLLLRKPLEPICRVLSQHITLDELGRIAARKILEVAAWDLRRLEWPCFVRDVDEIGHEALFSSVI